MIRFVARTIVRLAYAVALLALLGAIPAGLIYFVGWPLPDHMPSGEELYRFLTSGMSDRTVLDAVALLLWPVWALFTIAVVLEAAAKIRGVQAPRIGALAPVQGLAAVLVAGITAGVFATASVGPLTTALGPAPASVAAPTTHVQEPPRAIPVSALSHYDTASQQNVALTRTAGTITLVVGDCGYTYKVVKNDSLWRIAKECLGDPERWPEIWELNKGKYWPHISGHTKFRDPDLIFPGWVLTLPADAVVPPGAEPVTPPAAQPPAQTPAPSTSPSTNPSPSPSTPAPHSPSPSVSVSPSTAAADDGVYDPPTAAGSPTAATSPAHTGAPSGSPSATTSSSASPAADMPSEQESHPAAGPLDGIDLPGGWIPIGLGAGLLAAVAMVWRRRRHRYKPTPITTPRLDDPDLVPPLAAMTRIRQNLRRAAPESLDPAPPPAPTVREYHTAEIKPQLPPVGPSGADLAGAGTLPLATGLGLQGPAALDAARGLLVATLTSGSDDDPDAKGRAIIPASTLATLLGVSALEIGPITRLTVTDTIADAITHLEEEIIRRARLAADAQAATVQALRDTDIHAEPLPQLLLITELPDPAWNSRLTTAVRLGHSVDIGAALLGEWPTGTTLHVAEDGTTGDTDDDPRLAVLDAATTVEMLGLLREAHGDAEPVKPATATPVGAQTKTAQPTPTSTSDDQPADETTPVASTAPAAAGLPVVVRVLGRPAILGPDGRPMGGLRTKALELLVYLAVHRKGAALGDIMESLYPDATMRRASERLSTVVGNLRGVIRHAAATGDSPDTAKPRLEPVVNTGGHYHLDPAVVAVDWWTVVDHYAQVAHAADDQQRLVHLTAALEAGTGSLADGTDYDWIDTDREVVRRHQIKLKVHAAALHADTDPHQAWLLLDQACELDPLSEELACQAMRAAAATGDADAIRHQLKTLRDALDDAGIELDTDTETLAKDLLRQLQRPQPSE